MHAITLRSTRKQKAAAGLAHQRPRTNRRSTKIPMDNTNTTSNAAKNQGIESLTLKSAKKRQNTFELYADWARAAGITPLPPTDAAVARYVREHADLLAFATLRHRVSVIRQSARAAGYTWPADDLLTRRALSEAYSHSGPRVAEPLVERDLRDLTTALKSGASWRDARDLALIQTGARAGLDVLELIRLTPDDVSFDGAAAAIEVGARPWLAPPRLFRSEDLEQCPVRAVEVWFAIRESAPRLFYDVDDSGAFVALTPVDVKTIVQRRMRQIGRDERRFGHASLRSSFIFARPMPRALAELAGETW
jgi:integrase